ncbi:MAG: hypothetical protein K0S58_2832 [Nitrospira sp.]|jgi:hypothetical protein|nr:hypothetical protein [Nitrospira sp.]
MILSYPRLVDRFDQVFRLDRRMAHLRLKHIAAGWQAVGQRDIPTDDHPFVDANTIQAATVDPQGLFQFIDDRQLCREADSLPIATNLE